MRAKEVDISPFSSNKITIKMFSRSIFYFAYDPTSQTEVNQWHRETGVIYATPVSPESSYTYGLQHNANTLFLQRYFPFLFNSKYSQLGKNHFPSLFITIYDTFYPIKNIAGKFQCLFRMPFFQK